MELTRLVSCCQNVPVPTYFLWLKKPKPFIRHIEVSGKMKIKYDGTCSMWIWHYLKDPFCFHFSSACCEAQPGTAVHK